LQWFSPKSARAYAPRSNGCLLRQNDILATDDRHTHPNVRAHTAFEPFVRLASHVCVRPNGRRDQCGERRSHVSKCQRALAQLPIRRSRNPEAWAKDLFDECRPGTAKEGAPGLLRCWAQ